MNGCEERATSTTWQPTGPVGAAWLTAALVAGLVACSEDVPRTFKTPEQAIEALESVLAEGDASDLEALMGPGSPEQLRSGDEVADREDVAQVLELLRQKVAFEDVDEVTKYPVFGEAAWPFPIPLASDGKRWHFDMAEGIEEIYNRRVGRNELYTLATLHAFVDAQREYYAARPQGDPPVFAQRFSSEPDTRNGLYWPSVEGAPESPFGEMVAQAAAEGYGDGSGNISAAELGHYQGYHYRILTGQGPNAAGGERSYLDAEGRMTSGFAAVAWPASYGNSGIMTFQVNRQGIVFQKDLGDGTESAAQAITVYDPDETWTPTGD